MVTMEPTPAYDKEFNDWYDMEPMDVKLFGDAARYLDIVNEYTPYWTRGPLAGVFGEK